MSAFLEPNSFIASLLSEADQQAIYQQVILQINTVLSVIKYSYKQLERFNKTNRFYITIAIPVGANILWSWFRTQPVLAALESLDTEFLDTDIIN